MKPIYFHGLHKQLWEWMSEDPENNIQADWPHWSYSERGVHCIFFEGEPYEVEVDCFCCEARTSLAEEIGYLDEDETCCFCPHMETACDMDSPLGECLDGLYKQFLVHCKNKNFTNASEVALEIAALPLKHSDRWEINTMRFDDIKVQESGN